MQNESSFRSDPPATVDGETDGETDGDVVRPRVRGQGGA